MLALVKSSRAAKYHQRLINGLRLYLQRYNEELKTFVHDTDFIQQYNIIIGKKIPRACTYSQGMVGDQSFFTSSRQLPSLNEYGHPLSQQDSMIKNISDDNYCLLDRPPIWINIMKTQGKY